MRASQPDQHAGPLSHSRDRLTTMFVRKPSFSVPSSGDPANSIRLIRQPCRGSPRVPAHVSVFVSLFLGVLPCLAVPTRKAQVQHPGTGERWGIGETRASAILRSSSGWSRACRIPMDPRRMTVQMVCLWCLTNELADSLSDDKPRGGRSFSSRPSPRDATVRAALHAPSTVPSSDLAIVAAAMR